MSQGKPAPSGETQATEAGEARESSKVVRFGDFNWEGVEARSYKKVAPAATWHGVDRHLLIGESGEATPFQLRYFEIEPGGYTSHEKHAHQHAVVVLRGRGEVLLGERWQQVGFGDVVYVAPNDPHQFRTVGDAPFGFLCVVDANRDRPRPPSGALELPGGS